MQYRGRIEIISQIPEIVDEGSDDADDRILLVSLFFFCCASHRFAVKAFFSCILRNKNLLII
jgi:hypothetical protein